MLTYIRNRQSQEQSYLCIRLVYKHTIQHCGSYYKTIKNTLFLGFPTSSGSVPNTVLPPLIATCTTNQTNHISLKNRPRFYAKSPTAQDASQPIAHFISCTGWPANEDCMLSHAQNADRWLKRSVEFLCNCSSCSCLSFEDPL